MRIYIRSTNFQLWLVIKNGEEVPMKKVEDKLIPKTEDEFDAEDIKKVENYAKAINMHYCAVNPDDYRKISCCSTAKEMWDKLEVTYEGTDQVREAKIDFLTQEYEMFRMKEHENIDDMFVRFSKIVNDLHTLKKTYTDRDLVRKILRSLTSEWQSKVDAIYESIGTSNVTIESLRGNLKMYESTILNPSLNDQRKGIALKASNEPTMNDSSDDDEVKLVMKKFCKLLRNKEKVEDGLVCYGCGEVGHIKNKCPRNGRNTRCFKKHRAYISWGGDSSDESTDQDEDETANLCLMAHMKTKPTMNKNDNFWDRYRHGDRRGSLIQRRNWWNPSQKPNSSSIANDRILDTSAPRKVLHREGLLLFRPTNHLTKNLQASFVLDLEEHSCSKCLFAMDTESLSEFGIHALKSAIPAPSLDQSLTPSVLNEHWEGAEAGMECEAPVRTWSDAINVDRQSIQLPVAPTFTSYNPFGILESSEDHEDPSEARNFNSAGDMIDLFNCSSTARMMKLNALEDASLGFEEPALYTHSEGEKTVFIDSKLEPFRIITPSSSNMSLQLPKLAKGYDDWKIMMEAHLYALHDCMWMVLEDGPLKIQMENPERNPAAPDVVQYIPKPKEKWDDRDCKKHNLDNVAKATIFKTLDPITFSKIKHLKTAMEIWQEVLLEKFKSFKMLPGESFDMLDERFHKILNDLASLNHILSPKEKNLRLLRSLPTEWYTKATAMEEGRNLENYTVQGLLDELRTYEHELKKKKEEQVTPFPTALMTTPRIPSSEGTCTRNCDTPSSSQPTSSKMENYDDEFAMMVKQFWKFKKFFKKADSIRRPSKGKSQVSDSPPESYLCYNCRKPGHWNSSSDEEAFVCMERRVGKSNHEDRWTMSEDDTLCLMAKDDADQEFKKMMKDFEEINLKHSSLTEENKLLSEENLKLTQNRKSQLNEITQLKTENESLSEKVKSLNKELGILKSQEAVNKLLETTKQKGRKGLGFDPSSSQRKGKTTFIPPKPTAKPNKQKGKEKEKPTEVPKKDMESLKNISTNEVILTGKRIRNIYEVIWNDVKEACLISKDLLTQISEKMKIVGANIHFQKLEAKCSSPTFYQSYLEMIAAQELSEFLHMEIRFKYENEVLEFYKNGKVKTVKSMKDPQRTIQVINSTVGGTKVKLLQKKLGEKLHLPNSGVEIGRLPAKNLDWNIIGISGQTPSGPAKNTHLNNDYKLVLELVIAWLECGSGEHADDITQERAFIINALITKSKVNWAAHFFNSISKHLGKPNQKYLCQGLYIGHILESLGAASKGKKYEARYWLYYLSSKGENRAGPSTTAEESSSDNVLIMSLNKSVKRKQLVSPSPSAEAPQNLAPINLEEEEEFSDQGELQRKKKRKITSPSTSGYVNPDELKEKEPAEETSAHNRSPQQLEEEIPQVQNSPTSSQPQVDDAENQFWQLYYDWRAWKVGNSAEQLLNWDQQLKNEKIIKKCLGLPVNYCCEEILDVDRVWERNYEDLHLEHLVTSPISEFEVDDEDPAVYKPVFSKTTEDQEGSNEELQQLLHSEALEILTNPCEITNPTETEIPEKSAENLEMSKTPETNEAQEEQAVEAQRSSAEAEKETQMAELEASKSPRAIFEGQNEAGERDSLSRDISNFTLGEAEEESERTLKINDEEDVQDDVEFLPMQLFQRTPSSHQVTNFHFHSSSIPILPDEVPEIWTKKVQGLIESALASQHASFRQEIEQIEARHNKLIEKFEETHCSNLKEISKSMDKTLEILSLLSNTVSNTMETYASDSYLPLKEVSKIREQIANVTVSLQKQMSILQMDIRAALGVSSANQVVTKDYLKVNQNEECVIDNVLGEAPALRSELEKHNEQQKPARVENGGHEDNSLETTRMMFKEAMKAAWDDAEDSFNWGKPELRCDILDSSFAKAKKEERYEEMPSLVLKMLADFLEQQEFRNKAAFIHELKPERIGLPWSDAKQVYEYGVATIRHMETYKGDGAKGWDCGLSKLNHKPHLVLRMMYCAAILLHEVNEMMEMVANESFKNDKVVKGKNLE
ncbi:unnamed protein product [Cuscuta campestris]|uniref:CCHC-type domain-containing protein n=1 Tax=Cuscuta campestris TaxID=132261 RepID=A0A484MPJ2_9ASTE|nr:unnamed protein product [Cuscuta campestris]